MRIVIAGSGRVGGVLAARLVAEQHAVTVIDRSREVCDRIFEEIGAITVCGDATDPHVLESAGIGAADIAAGLLTRDADNLAFAMLVRSLSGARVMVRMFESSYEQAYRLAGVRDLIAEADVVMAKMALAIEFPDVVGSLPLGRGDAVLFEVPIASRSLVAGKTVADIRGLASFPADCVFIGLVDEDGRIELPKGSSVLRAGHLAVLVATKAEIAHAIACLTAQPEARQGLPGILPTLRKIDFLSPLSDDELAEVARGIELVRREPGEVIFRRGEPGNSFFIVLSGEVALGPEPKSVSETRRRGDFFGEVSLLTGEPRSLDATAVTEVELASIGKDDFRQVVMANPAVALELSRILGQRLAEAAREQSTKKRGFFGR
ncbi:cyclic nucleotide-binding domain-containing protein [Myxococcota bacterium]|nr:cyclic nucleotide-binding domain-containing protein [Myxococcota bacterium]